MSDVKSFRGEFAFLSNLYNVPVEYRGIVYQNSEAAFQAQKCADDGEKKRFASIGGVDAKRMGKRVALREDWEQVKFSVMTDIVREKFMQNPDLANKLRSTGNARLEEGNTWGDRTWGTVNGQGKNMLGNILMLVRLELSMEHPIPCNQSIRSLEHHSRRHERDNECER